MNINLIATDVLWDKLANLLKVYCYRCGHTFYQRVDRYTAYCPTCGNRGSTVRLRNELVGFKEPPHLKEVM
jgi:ribosomal protein L37E